MPIYIPFRTLTFLGIALAVRAAAGQTPASPHTGIDVIRAMHDRYASTWYSTLSFTESADQSRPDGTTKSEKWWEEAKLPGLLRIDVGVPPTDNTTQRRRMMFVNGVTYVSVPGKPVQQDAKPNLLLVLGFDVYKQPVERTAQILTAQGFDLSKMHTDTWHARPVYVVGARSGDTTSQQFWVDADRLLFVRLLDASKPGGAVDSEALFDDYRPLAGGWIAAEVTFSRSGAVRLHEIYSDIQANVPLSDALFDPAQLH